MRRRLLSRPTTLMWCRRMGTGLRYPRRARRRL
ncbi:hypothetical protein CVT25_001183 [Psilocybe cyanescens]|uniref:Uncharacterized protein n=1 Tax=Psilocybe cyanescens TaxID=93625 RepID=A0A409XKC1_PSICY|nr:hypothetical protein CVT25_001183 [Psilocybe cyanescens]